MSTYAIFCCIIYIFSMSWTMNLPKFCAILTAKQLYCFNFSDMMIIWKVWPMIYYLISRSCQKNMNRTLKTLLNSAQKCTPLALAQNEILTGWEKFKQNSNSIVMIRDTPQQPCVMPKIHKSPVQKPKFLGIYGEIQ